MGNTSTYKNIALWEDLIKRHKKARLIEYLKKAPAIEIAEFIEKQPDHEISISILVHLPAKLFANIFIEFEDDFQKELYSKWDKRTFARVFSLIPSQHRADFYKLLSEKEQTKLLPYLTKNVRQDVITLSAYESNTVGSTMSTDFATIMCDMNVRKAIKKLREDAPSKKMMYYLYVVDHNMRMIGFVSLKDLVMSDPDTNVMDCIHENYISANVTDDKELVAQQIEKYDLLAIPILNEEKQLVGILRYDDAMDVIRAEETEDMEKFMGIMPNEETADYTSISVLHHFRKRIVWIVGLFIASFISEMIIHQNESLLSKIAVLGMYLPMIAGAGGNAGSQAATVVIRALSLGHVSLTNWLQIIFKETRIACLISLCLFVIAFAKVIILSLFTSTTDTVNIYKLAFAISLALSLQVISSAMIGASLPLIAKHFKGDPAVAASPAITTLVDITGVIIYFAITIRILI